MKFDSGVCGLSSDIGNSPVFQSKVVLTYCVIGARKCVEDTYVLSRDDVCCCCCCLCGVEDTYVLPIDDVVWC